MTRAWLLFILALFLGAYLRFSDFGNRLTFGPEQAMSLLWSADYLRRPSLLGQPYFRFTSTGHQLFNSPLFNYALLLLLLIFNYHPLPITAVFAFLNLTTGGLIYFLLRRLIGSRAAAIAAFLFLTNGYMIFHSRFIWIVHPFPLLGLLSLYFLLKRKFWLLGFITGLGMGLDYTYIFFGLPLLLAALFKSSARLKTLAIFILGAILGDLPRIIFELRHQFYNTLTLWQYFTDTLANPGQSAIHYYHFLPYWPVLAVGVGWMMSRYRRLTAVLLTAYLYFNLTSPLVSSTYEISLPDQVKAATAIATDTPQNFNVVSLLDFDTRGHILRYLLRYRYGLVPRPVDDYRWVTAVYAISRTDYDLSRPANYELREFYPYRVSVLRSLDPPYVVYKLIKGL